MKFSIAIIMAAFATAAMASSVSEGYSIRHARDVVEDVNTVEGAPMVFTGQAFVGGPNVTISGTAETVYAELLKLNPAYDPWDFPDYQERMGEFGITRETPEEDVYSLLAPSKRSLVKRNGIVCNVRGEKVGNAQTQCLEGRLYLARLNGYCGAPAGPGGCSRVSCSTNCGVFLCNDNSFGISVWCGNLAGDMDDIHRACGERFESTSGFLVVRLKGQIFRDGPPKWNTHVRAQSC